MSKRHNKIDMQDAEEWQFILNDVKEELQRAKEQLDLRNKKLSTGSDVTKINANIRKAMQNIDYDLKDLKDVLPKLRAEISDKDIARRRDECDQLISEKNELMRQFQRTQTPNLYNRDPIEEYDRNKMGEDPEHLKNLESQQVLDYQRDVIKKQDEGLDRISQALDRTKQIGMSISDELDEQNVLLDKLDDDVDGTSRNLKKQTNRIAKLIQRSSIACGVITIVVLVLLLVILIAVAIFTFDLIK